MAKTVCAYPSFCKYYWTATEIDMLLDPIKVHIAAISAIRNRFEKALTLTSHKWGMDIEEYICCQSLVERLLKLIASVVN